MKRSTLKTLCKAFWVLGNIILLALMIIAIVSALRRPQANIEWEQQTYTVQAGDTLWNIGKEHCPENTHIGWWVQEVQKLNGITDNIIRPNQKIIILTPQ